MVGTAVEFYDFYIYGTAAALAFPTVFFPNLSPALGTVASMGSFGTAFVSRPLGAAVFGHFGDRMGRKKTLVATLSIMGLSTVAVGLIPSAAAIGIAAPLLVLILRLLQGFAVGGEWAGSALLGAESAPADKRGQFGMFTPLGVGVALVLTSLTFLLVNITIGQTSHAFAQWGWRVPFLLSAVLIAIALYVRINIGETPVFTAQRAQSRAPIAEAIRHQPGYIVLASGSVVAVFCFVFMGGTYLASYAHSRLALSSNAVLWAGLSGGVAWTAVVPLSARMSDRFGRRPVILSGWILGLPWSLAIIPLIETRDAVLFAVAIIGIYALAYAPMTSFIPELFPTRYRYSGAGLAMNLAGIVGGAGPPLRRLGHRADDGGPGHRQLGVDFSAARDQGNGARRQPRPARNGTAEVSYPGTTVAPIYGTRVARNDGCVTKIHPGQARRGLRRYVEDHCDGPQPGSSQQPGTAWPLQAARTTDLGAS